MAVLRSSSLLQALLNMQSHHNTQNLPAVTKAELFRLGFLVKEESVAPWDDGLRWTQLAVDTKHNVFQFFKAELKLIKPD